MCDYSKVRPGNKDIVIIRTESGRFFKISKRATRRIKTDGHIDENNGLVRKAVQVSPSYVAELYARFGAGSAGSAGDGAINPKTKMKDKASGIRRIRKKKGNSKGRGRFPYKLTTYNCRYLWNIGFRRGGFL